MVVALACCAGTSPVTAANDPAGLDGPSSPVAPSAVEIRIDDLAPRPAARAREPRGNPLWAIPLSALSATRERPLFLPSRRPPVPPAVAGPPVVVAAKPVEDDRPQVTLVGAVAGDTEGFAVFIDLRTNATVRLRTGQEHAGWTLSSVKGREAILAKEKETLVFALPAPGTNGTPPVMPGMPGLAAVDEAAVAATPDGHGAVPPSGQLVVIPKNPRDFAPFMPRSTPANGEPDGL
jgi:general secretion pathway protein N